MRREESCVTGTTQSSHIYSLFQLIVASPLDHQNYAHADLDGSGLAGSESSNGSLSGPRGTRSVAKEA